MALCTFEEMQFFGSEIIYIRIYILYIIIYLCIYIHVYIYIERHIYIYNLFLSAGKDFLLSCTVVEHTLNTEV